MAYDGHKLPLVDREAHAVQRAHLVFSGIVDLVHIPDIDDGLFQAHPSLCPLRRHFFHLTFMQRYCPAGFFIFCAQ